MHLILFVLIGLIAGALGWASGEWSWVRHARRSGRGGRRRVPGRWLFAVAFGVVGGASWSACSPPSSGRSILLWVIRLVAPGRA